MCQAIITHTAQKKRGYFCLFSLKLFLNNIIIIITYFCKLVLIYVEIILYTTTSATTTTTATTAAADKLVDLWCSLL